MTELDFMCDFVDAVKYEMNEQGISKIQLANMSRLSKSTITRILSEDYIPTIRAVNNICTVLGMDVYDILPCEHLML